MCRNAHGMNNNVPDHLVKAEMGAFPMTGVFFKYTFHVFGCNFKSYLLFSWQRYFLSIPVYFLFITAFN